MNAPKSLYAEMIEATRRWIEGEHPEMLWACITGHIGNDVPDLVIPVTPCRAAISSKPLALSS